MKEYSVEPISIREAKPWILKKHYARRMPCVEYAFGFYNLGNLEGVIAYGPTCRSLNQGYGAFGTKLVKYSFELLRLCIDSENKNAASFLVGNSLKMLPKPAFVVSYADCNVGHVGYVYQATNWLYCGVTKKETVYIDTENNKKIHPRTVVSTYGSRNKNVLPDNIIIEKEEHGKHRYVKFLGNKSEIKKMKDYFKYDILPYPKGNTKRHENDIKIETHKILF